MGVDQLAFNPSLRSLTHALGLDDDSIEEILSPNSIQRGSTGRPPSIASSIISEYDRSAGMPRSPESAQSMYRSPYSSAKTGHQIPEKKAADTDLRHLTCLQYCQVTGSNTCPSIAAAASEKPYERSCDDLSITSSRSNFKLQRNSTLRSHSVYLEPSQRHARNRSSCSLLSKVLPFGSRKDVSTSSNLAWSQCVPDVSIKDNAAHAAINAGLSGMPFADLILVSATDGLETHVHSYILSSVCPLLLQKIGADNTLDLDIDRTRHCSISPSSQMKPSSRSKWTKPKSWWRGSKRSHKPANDTLPSGKTRPESMASESTLSVDVLPRPCESVYSNRPRRVQVSGCNGPDLRAFCFYLYTNQFRLVPSHSIEGVDDSNAFRGHAKGSSSTSATDSDETAWDPIRIRKSRSLHDVLWPEKEAGLRARRSSTHTLVSLHSTAPASPLLASTGALPCRPYQDSSSYQQSASQAPPFSVQGAYHLSQLFNLTHLACASSSFFFHRLTLTNALQYYISPFSIAYPLIQSGCLDYLVRHWTQVSTQTQSQTILGRLAAGWYPQANMALLQLLGKVE